MARIPTADDLGYVTPQPARANTLSGATIEAMQLPSKMAAQQAQINSQAAARDERAAGQFARVQEQQARDLGGLGNTIGRAGTEIATTLQAQQDKADDYEVTKTLLAFDKDQERSYDEAKRAMQPGGEGFADGWRAQYDDSARGVIAAAKSRGYSPATLQKLDKGLVRWGEKLHTMAWHAELNERDRFHTEDVEKSLFDLQNRVTENPDRVQDYIAAGSQLIGSSKLSNVGKMRMARKFPALMEEIAARVAIEKDPETAIRHLQMRPKGDSDAPAGGGDAVEFIKDVEGTQDNGWDYRQYSGPYGVKRGRDEKLSLGDAEIRLKAEVADVQREIDAAIKVPLSDGQRTALTSLFYNIGTGKRRLETVAEMINAGRVDDVPAWIRQFNRNADGGYMKGLADRRDKEAKLFASSPATEKGDTEPAGQDDGNADPLERYQFSDAAPYRHMPYLTRSKLLNVARTAMSATVQQQLKDDIEEIRRTGSVATDANGATSLDRAGRVLTRNQVEKARIQWNEARQEHAALAPLRDMSEAQYGDHLEKLMPDEKAADGESYKSAARVFDKTEHAWKKIQEQRTKDPAAAVATSPEVADAIEQVKRGRRSSSGVVQNADGSLDVQVKPERALTPQQAQEKVIDARLAAQARLGIPDYARKVIDRREAAQLLQMPPPDTISEKEFTTRLNGAAKRAQDIYGPRYGIEAFKAAVSYQLHGEKTKDEVAGVVSKMVRGETVTPADVDRMGALDRIDAIGRDPTDTGFYVRPDMNVTGGPAISPVTSMDVSTRLTDYAQGRARAKPTQQQIDWVNQDPGRRMSVFDQEFGQGAWARTKSGSSGGDKPKAPVSR